MLRARADKQDKASPSITLLLQTGYKTKRVKEKKKKMRDEIYDYIHVCIMYIYPIIQALY